jgi:hypothetical protein
LALSGSCRGSRACLLTQAEFGQLLPEILIERAKSLAVVLDNVGEDVDGPD